MPHEVESGRHPFRQFLLKVHSRCDLACRYCYVYTKTDQRWVDRPPMMSANTIDHAARRIAEHVADSRLTSVSVVLHGGEPLLAGISTITHCATSVRGAVGNRAAVNMAIQTNGVRLDAALLDVLRAHSFRVSVSLDGDREANDRHRRFRNGRGSHEFVTRALRELGRPENAELFAGILCTVDLDNDPVRTYESLLKHRPPQIDFLLPEGNWTDRPPGRTDDSAHTPYADWLIRVFDRWYDHPVKDTGIRIFDDILSLVLGGVRQCGGPQHGADGIHHRGDGRCHRGDGRPHRYLSRRCRYGPDGGGERIRRRLANPARARATGGCGGAVADLRAVLRHAYLRRWRAFAQIPPGKRFPQPECVLPRPLPTDHPRPA